MAESLIQRDVSPEGARPAPEPRRALGDRLLRPTLPELWLFLALALPGLAALIATLPTVDLAYQLRAGADILAGHGVPTVDTWTFTAAGRPWLDQQWGAQAILAAVFNATGWSGLAILRAALVVATMGGIIVAIRLRGPSMRPRTVALLAIAAFVVMAPALALRPQLLAMALFGATLAIVAGRAQHPRAMGLIGFITVAWANIHGSFVLVPVLFGLAWLEDLHDHAPRANYTLLATIFATFATFITPYGVDAWRYAIGLAGNSEVRSRISEWQPPGLTDVPGALFWLSVAAAAVTVVILARRGRTVAWPAVLALVVFAGLGAMAARGVAWWPGVATVVIAGIACGAPIDDATPRREPRGSALNSLVAAVLVAAGIAFLPFWRSTDPGLGAPSGLLGQAPSRTTAALRDIATPADRVWNQQVWGSWLEFAVPAAAYALDARIEVIPAGVWAEADTVAAARPGWQAILDRYTVTIVVTEGPDRSRLAAALTQDATWVLAQSDDVGMVWVRSTR